MTCMPKRDEIIEQDPSANKDYGWDWERWLNGDTIATSSWMANKSGLDLDDGTWDTTSTTIWISGGTLGEGYTVTNHVITVGGRADDRSFKVVIKNQ